MSDPRRDCPECQTAMQPIKLIDATDPGLGRGGVGHVELSYAAPEAEPSFFLGAIQRQGIVKGFICPACGRITLYGVPEA